MTPFLPSEILTGSWELICCACTAVVAVLSCLLAVR
jgi:hypothetical protein